MLPFTDTYWQRHADNSKQSSRTWKSNTLGTFSLFSNALCFQITDLGCFFETSPPIVKKKILLSTTYTCVLLFLEKRLLLCLNSISSKVNFKKLIANIKLFWFFFFFIELIGVIIHFILDALNLPRVSSSDKFTSTIQWIKKKFLIHSKTKHMRRQQNYWQNY